MFTSQLELGLLVTALDFSCKNNSSLKLRTTPFFLVGDVVNGSKQEHENAREHTLLTTI